MEMYGSPLKTEIHQVSTCLRHPSKERENQEIYIMTKVKHSFRQLTTSDANLGDHYYKGELISKFVTRLDHSCVQSQLPFLKHLRAETTYPTIA
jgi:hypothetical protein